MISNIKVDGQTLAIATRDSSVFVSTNNGQLWQRNWAGIEGFTVKELVLVAPDRLYAATEQNGVFIATIGGTAWTPFSQGINDLNMRGVALGMDGSLYAITDSGAVFKTTSPVTNVWEAVSTIPTVFVLEQNYPNPFNPATTINYSIPEADNVEMKVYDVLGNEVATLVNEAKAPGNYTTVFDASSFASGVYIYTLRTNKFVQTKKMILMK